MFHLNVPPNVPGSDDVNIRNQEHNRYIRSVLSALPVRKFFNHAVLRIEEDTAVVGIRDGDVPLYISLGALLQV